MRAQVTARERSDAEKQLVKRCIEQHRAAKSAAPLEDAHPRFRELADKYGFSGAWARTPPAPYARPARALRSSQRPM